MRCEDYPCCGHEQGCCPDFDESGKQLNMKCVCGATLPVNARYSICDSCMNSPDEDGFYDREMEYDRDEVDEDEDFYDHYNRSNSDVDIDYVDERPY